MRNIITNSLKLKSKMTLTKQMTLLSTSKLLKIQTMKFSSLELEKENSNSEKYKIKKKNFEESLIKLKEASEILKFNKETPENLGLDNRDFDNDYSSFYLQKMKDSSSNLNDVTFEDYEFVEFNEMKTNENDEFFTENLLLNKKINAIKSNSISQIHIYLEEFKHHVQNLLYIFKINKNVVEKFSEYVEENKTLTNSNYSNNYELVNASEYIKGTIVNKKKETGGFQDMEVHRSFSESLKRKEQYLLPLIRNLSEILSGLKYEQFKSQLKLSNNDFKHINIFAKLLTEIADDFKTHQDIIFETINLAKILKIKKYTKTFIILGKSKFYQDFKQYAKFFPENFDINTLIKLLNSYSETNHIDYIELLQSRIHELDYLKNYDLINLLNLFIGDRQNKDTNKDYLILELIKSAFIKTDFSIVNYQNIKLFFIVSSFAMKRPSIKPHLDIFLKKMIKILYENLKQLNNESIKEIFYQIHTKSVKIELENNILDEITKRNKKEVFADRFDDALNSKDKLVDGNDLTTKEDDIENQENDENNENNEFIGNFVFETEDTLLEKDKENNSYNDIIDNYDLNPFSKLKRDIIQYFYCNYSSSKVELEKISNVTLFGNIFEDEKEVFNTMNTSVPDMLRSLNLILQNPLNYTETNKNITLKDNNHTKNNIYLECQTEIDFLYSFFLNLTFNKLNLYKNFFFKMILTLSEIPIEIMESSFKNNQKLMNSVNDENKKMFFFSYREIIDDILHINFKNSNDIEKFTTKEVTNQISLNIFYFQEYLLKLNKHFILKNMPTVNSKIINEQYLFYAKLLVIQNKKETNEFYFSRFNSILNESIKDFDLRLIEKLQFSENENNSIANKTDTIDNKYNLFIDKNLLLMIKQVYEEDILEFCNKNPSIKFLYKIQPNLMYTLLIISQFKKEIFNSYEEYSNLKLFEYKSSYFSLVFIELIHTFKNFIHEMYSYAFKCLNISIMNISELLADSNENLNIPLIKFDDLFRENSINLSKYSAKEKQVGFYLSKTMYIQQLVTFFSDLIKEDSNVLDELVDFENKKNKHTKNEYMSEHLNPKRFEALYNFNFSKINSKENNDMLNKLLRKSKEVNKISNEDNDILNESTNLWKHIMRNIKEKTENNNDTDDIDDTSDVRDDMENKKEETATQNIENKKTNPVDSNSPTNLVLNELDLRCFNKITAISSYLINEDSKQIQENSLTKTEILSILNNVKYLTNKKSINTSLHKNDIHKLMLKDITNSLLEKLKFNQEEKEIIKVDDIFFFLENESLTNNIFPYKFFEMAIRNYYDELNGKTKFNLYKLLLRFIKRYENLYNTISLKRELNIILNYLQLLNLETDRLREQLFDELKLEYIGLYPLSSDFSDKFNIEYTNSTSKSIDSEFKQSIEENDNAKNEMRLIKSLKKYYKELDLLQNDLKTILNQHRNVKILSFYILYSKDYFFQKCLINNHILEYIIHNLEIVSKIDYLFEFNYNYKEYIAYMITIIIKSHEDSESNYNNSVYQLEKINNLHSNNFSDIPQLNILENHVKYKYSYNKNIKHENIQKLASIMDLLYIKSPNISPTVVRDISYTNKVKIPYNVLISMVNTLITHNILSLSFEGSLVNNFNHGFELFDHFLKVPLPSTMLSDEDNEIYFDGIIRRFLNFKLHNIKEFDMLINFTIVFSKFGFNRIIKNIIDYWSTRSEEHLNKINLSQEEIGIIRVKVWYLMEICQRMEYEI